MKKYLLFICFISLSLSGSAQQQEIDDPIKNFEALWITFQERYANFALKQIDWEQIYQEYQPQITPQTTNIELYEICCAMLQELKDGHVTLEPNFEESEIDCGPPYAFRYDQLLRTEADQRLFAQAMNTTFSNHGFSNVQKVDVSEETNFQYRVSPDWGYLRVDEMTEKLILRKLEKGLNQAMQAFQGKKGLILDMRFNGGGWDYAGLKIARRLICEKKISHYKKKRKKGTDSFTPLKTIYLKPKGKFPFTKPIIILTSDYTASAAEVFVLALKDLPYVTLLGDITEGIFSDMYPFTLPNGWDITLSHMQFFSADMANFEGKGIEPDVKMLNSRDDLSDKRDYVLEKAIELLQNGVN